MQFGTRKAEAPEDNFTGDYLRNFKGGETKVRFIEEHDDWIVFREHYTLENKSFPCTQDPATCPGCTSEIEKVKKANKKWATNLALVDQQMKVLPFRIPITVGESLVRRAERNGGTLLNRDYVIMKSGSGLETEYDVDQEDKYPVDLDSLRPQGKNIQDVLKAQFIEVWGDLDAPRSVAPPLDLNKLEDPPFSAPATQSASAGTPDEVELSEAQLRAMDKDDLRNLCDKAGLKWEQDEVRSELVEKLLTAFGD